MTKQYRIVRALPNLLIGNSGWAAEGLLLSSFGMRALPKGSANMPQKSAPGCVQESAKIFFAFLIASAESSPRFITKHHSHKTSYNWEPSPHLAPKGQWKPGRNASPRLPVQPLITGWVP